MTDFWFVLMLFVLAPAIGALTALAVNIVIDWRDPA